MDPAHAPFLAAIIDDIDSDAPRLHYADFLDETGEPNLSARAEFIRLQCAMPGIDPNDSRFEQLSRREEELLQSHWRDWFAPVREALGEPEFVRWLGFSWWGRPASFELVPARAERGFVLRSDSRVETKFSTRARFRRGFVDEITVSDPTGAGRIPDYEKLLLAAPIRAINLEENQRAVERLLSANRTGQLRSLRVFLHLSDWPLWRVAEAPESNHLRHLAILSMGAAEGLLLENAEGRILQNAITVVLASRHFKGLRHLEINLVSRIRPDLSRLIGSSLLRRLEKLEIRAPNCSPGLAAELIRPYVTPAMKQLRLSLIEELPSEVRLAAARRFGTNFTTSFFEE